MSNKSLKVDEELGKYGEVFQFRLVKYMMENEFYFNNINHIVDQNMFSNVLLRTYVGTMKNYFNKSGCTPDYDTMEMLLVVDTFNDIDAELYREINKKIRYEVTSEACDEVETIATKFFLRQNFIKALNKCQNIISTGDVNKIYECQQIMLEATNINIHDDLGHDIYEFFDEALKENHRKVIPTGANKLDESLEGGLGKGEIGLIICPSGAGKTSFTTALSSYAATCLTEENNYEGYKVLQIFFESKYTDMARKHYGRITDIEAKDLSKEEYLGEVKNILINNPSKEIIRKNLKLQHFKNQDKTVSEIKQYIKTLINKGFKPDMVVIDYFECICLSKGYNKYGEWRQEALAYKELEAMAGELDVALWIPTQTDKSSLGGVTSLTGANASGSKGKYESSYVVISLPRTNEDIKNNVMTIDLIKNRNGLLSTWQGVEFNNGKCIINMDNAEHFSDTEEFQKVAEKVEDKIVKENLKLRRQAIERQVEEERLKALNNVDYAENFETFAETKVTTETETEREDYLPF
ncbi:MAG: AAA family ATPase [Novosphingobium sp.]|nr:AAA family ATPase [Novosphingobium sp.]